MSWLSKLTSGGGSSGGGGGGWSSGGSWGYSYDAEAYERERRERLEKAQAAFAKIEACADPEERLALRRKLYRCGANYVTTEEFMPWDEDSLELAALPNKARHTAAPSRGMSYMPTPSVAFDPREDLAPRADIDALLNSKVALYQGDITSIEVDAIVNAANSSLMGGGGIDGAIHGAAGPLLGDECATLGGCATGRTKITKGYNLPARNVLHTVGPIGSGDVQLRSCYRTCLELAERHRLKTVAFCCVGTGIYGFPLVRATHIALQETRAWLEELKAKGNASTAAPPAAQAEGAAPPCEDDDAAVAPGKSEGEGEERPYTLADVERIVFVVFRDVEALTYERLLPTYFPTDVLPGPDVARFDPRSDDDLFDEDSKADPMPYGGGSSYGSYGTSKATSKATTATTSVARGGSEPTAAAAFPQSGSVRFGGATAMARAESSEPALSPETVSVGNDGTSTADMGTPVPTHGTEDKVDEDTDGDCIVVDESAGKCPEDECHEVPEPQKE